MRRFCLLGRLLLLKGIVRLWILRRRVRLQNPTWTTLIHMASFLCGCWNSCFTSPTVDVHDASLSLPISPLQHWALWSKGNSNARISTFGPGLPQLVSVRIPLPLTAIHSVDPRKKQSDYVVNAKIPAAAAMNGIRQPSLINFLSLLEIDCFGQQYMKGISALFFILG